MKKRRFIALILLFSMFGSGVVSYADKVDDLKKNIAPLTNEIISIFEREKLTFSTALKSLVPNKRLRPLKVLVKSSTCNNGIIHFLCLQVLMAHSLLFL